MLDTVGLVWEISHVARVLREFHGRLGAPSRYGSVNGVYFSGWRLPEYGYVQLKRASWDWGYVVWERGHGQLYGGATPDAVIEASAELADLLGLDSRPRVSRVDFVADCRDGDALARARVWQPPARSRMVCAEYRHAGDVETVFWRNKSRALRVYDKAAEAGTSEPWYRVEIQNRRRWVERLVPGRVLDREALRVGYEVAMAEFNARALLGNERL